MIYFVRHLGTGEIKIGYTLCTTNRMQAIYWEMGPIELLAVVSGMRAEEQAMHDEFAVFRLRGEWFAPDPSLLAFIAGLTSVEPVGVVRDYRYRVEPSAADIEEEQRMLDMCSAFERRHGPVMYDNFVNDAAQR